MVEILKGNSLIPGDTVSIDTECLVPISAREVC